jgi:hypothetical protein
MVEHLDPRGLSREEVIDRPWVRMGAPAMAVGLDDHPVSRVNWAATQDAEPWDQE